MSSDWRKDENGPKWIDSPRIDSTAMLTAYQRSAKNPPHPPWYGELELYVHRFESFGAYVGQVDTSGCTRKECEEPSCHRCQIGKGGIKFRWFHESWKEAYKLGHKGPEAWCPDDTEEVSKSRDEAFQQKLMAIEEKERAAMKVMEDGVREAGGLHQYMVKLFQSP
jgi:hypothetical protein